MRRSITRPPFSRSWYTRAAPSCPERITPPHTFEPGDVVDVKVALPLPKDLEGGTYTLRLGVNGMAGTEGATTTFQVMRAE